MGTLLKLSLLSFCGPLRTYYLDRVPIFNVVRYYEYIRTCEAARAPPRGPRGGCERYTVMADIVARRGPARATAAAWLRGHRAYDSDSFLSSGATAAPLLL